MVEIVGGLIRACQGFAAAAATLMVGLLIAALFRYYLGPANTKRLFGGESLRSLPQSWLLGMLLPVCSIGVIPILRELKRIGVRPGALTAFALSAPLFNPLSLLYGLTLSRPVVVIAFALLSLLVVTILGLVWDRVARRPKTGSEEESELKGEGVIGIGRLWAVALMIGRELIGPSGAYAVVATLGLFLLGSVLPHGALQASVEQNDPWAPASMAAVAIPVYATPMLTISQLGMMFQHANAPGAALALLLLGTGVNVATLVWMTKNFGWRATSIWFVALVGLVLGCSYAVNRPLIPVGVEPAGHTHAFDVYTNPLIASADLGWRDFWSAFTRGIGLSEVVGLIGLGVIGLFGLIVRFWRLEVPVAEPVAQVATRHRYDVIVPAPVLGGVLIVGLIALSIVSSFAYYPEASEALEEIRVARVEALTAATSGNIDHAKQWIEVWDQWSRRLEVGVFLRTGEVRPYQRMQGYLLRKKLEMLEHELEHDPFEPEEVRSVVQQLLRMQGRYIRAFRE
jgi:uncharacterized membrane protein YraQ (UPF0718 family)